MPFKHVFVLSLVLTSAASYAIPAFSTDEHIALTPIRPALAKKIQACNPISNTFNPNVAGSYDLECTGGRHLVIEVIPTCPSGTYSGYSVQGIGEGKIYVPYCSIFREGRG